MKLGKTLREIDEMEAREFDEWVRIADESPWVLGIPAEPRAMSGSQIAAVFRRGAEQAR